MTDAAPWRPARDGVVLRVRLTPKSSKDAVEGVMATAEGPAVQARVRAVPEKGEANAALERLVADWLGVPRGTVSVDAGAKSRVKSVHITGDAARLAGAIAARLVPAAAPANRKG